MGTQRRAPAVAAMDVGSSKVIAAVAVPEDGGLRVLGVAQVGGAGVRRGAVVDLDAASAAFASVAERMRRVAGIPLPPVMLGSAGGEILSCNREAELRVDPPAPLGADHVADLMAEVRRTELPPGYQLVHAITQEYTVDGYEGCTDPVGMAAGRLGVRAHLVACHGTLLANLLRAADGAGLQVEDFAVSALAAAESVLTDDERRAGVLLCDLGATATQIAVVVAGETVGSATVALGGEHITADIAKGLRIPRDAAEDLKRRLATADTRAVVDRPLTGGPDAPPPDPPPPDAPGPDAAAPEAHASESILAEIVQARTEEILEGVARLLRDGGLFDVIGSGAVLTGGGSRLRGLSAVAMRTLGVRVRCGGPQGAEGLLGSPESAACVGLLQMSALRRTGGRRLTPILAGAARRGWPFRFWDRH